MFCAGLRTSSTGAASNFILKFRLPTGNIRTRDQKILIRLAGKYKNVDELKPNCIFKEWG
jgi:hypothetical protein